MAGKTLEDLDSRTVISEMGLDSVAALEFIGYLEEKLEVRLPDDELASITTLGDLDELLRRFRAV